MRGARRRDTAHTREGVTAVLVDQLPLAARGVLLPHTDGVVERARREHGAEPGVCPAHLPRRRVVCLELAECAQPVGLAPRDAHGAIRRARCEPCPVVVELRVVLAVTRDEWRR